VAKTIAGREKDLRFLEGAVNAGLVDEGVVRRRLSDTEVDERLRKAALDRIHRAFNYR
jgi:hypothetical protein